MVSDFVKFYQTKITAGEISQDVAQLLAVEKLSELEDRLAGYAPPETGFLSSLFGRKKDATDEAPKGVYLFGGVAP